MTTQPETAVEQRVSRIEGAYDQVNERLGDLTQAVTNLHNEVHEGDAALREDVRGVETRLRAEMTRQFHTMLVLMGTLWATTLGGIIAILVRG